MSLKATWRIVAMPDVAADYPGMVLHAEICHRHGNEWAFIARK